MLDEELARTVELIKASHTTFIGPKCPVLEELDEYEEGVTEILKCIGYRYGIRNAHISYWKWEKYCTMTLEVENSGVAPIYFPWKMFLYVYDSVGDQVQKVQIPIELTKLYGGMSVEIELTNVLIDEGYSYMVGIENPATGQPAVELNMECESKGKEYLLFSF